MQKLFLCAVALAAPCILSAQNLTGSWQGSLQLPQGRTLRIVFKITRADDESLKGTMYSIDQPGQPLNVNSIIFQSGTLKMTVTAIGASYEGRSAADGNSITGSWSQGPQPVPLGLVRETPSTAWTIPEPPPPPKLMSADSKPVFDVATIKPSKPGTPGSGVMVGRGGANTFSTLNISLKQLIVFAYGIHTRQLAGGPAWMEDEKFDITAKPDLPGLPNHEQIKAMVQKLLAERFQLEFHREQREMAAYAITVAKTGLKMTKTENSPGPLPGFGGRGPGNILVRNSTIAEFAGMMLSTMVDRPVVDLTGLSDRYDFTLLWTPDSPPPTTGVTLPTTPAAVDAPPDLFAAIQQQLGLRLEGTKSSVEVLVVDKISRPSEN